MATYADNLFVKSTLYVNFCMQISFKHTHKISPEEKCSKLNERVCFWSAHTIHIFFVLSLCRYIVHSFFRFNLENAKNRDRIIKACKWYGFCWHLFLHSLSASTDDCFKRERERERKYIREQEYAICKAGANQFRHCDFQILNFLYCLIQSLVRWVQHVRGTFCSLQESYTNNELRACLLLLSRSLYLSISHTFCIHEC